MKISNEKRINKNTLIGAFDLEMPSGLIVRGAMLFEKDGRPAPDDSDLQF